MPYTEDRIRQVWCHKRYLPVDVNSKEPFIFHSSYYKWCRSKNAINVITVHDFTYEYFYRGLRNGYIIGLNHVP